MYLCAFVYVAGEGGIGKTMWTKKVCSDWAKGDPALNRFKLVFRVVLANVKPGMTFEDIIFSKRKQKVLSRITSKMMSKEC